MMPSVQPRMMRCADIRRLLGGVCRTTVDRYVERGILPRPIKPTARLRLWDEAEVRASIAKYSAEPAN